MRTEPPLPVAPWAQLIAAVGQPDAGTDREANLAVAMALGAALTPDALACSVTQETATGYRTPVWSHQLALDLDEAQYRSGEGPCVATAADGQAHTITVMADEPLYPAFTAAAVGRGVRCSLSLPLRGPERPAALNLYARTASAYDSARARATADLLAHCVDALFTPSPAGRSGETAIDIREARAGNSLALGHALEQRSLVERALQELVDRGAPSQDQAYVQLTELSRTQGRSIFAVVADLVIERSADAPVGEGPP